MDQKKTNEQIVSALEAFFDGAPPEESAGEAPEAAETPDRDDEPSDEELRALGRLAEEGDLDARLECLGDQLSVLVRDDEASLTWRDGLIDTVLIGDVESSDDCGEALVAVMSAPAARGLRELRLWGTFDRFVPTLIEVGVPASLARLTLVAPDPHELHATMNLLRHIGKEPEVDPEIAARVPGVFGALGEAYPRLARLRELSLYAGGIDFGDIALPALEVAEIHTDFTSEQLGSIGRAKWPKLCRLELRFGVSVARGAYDVIDCDERGCAACTPDDLALMLQGDATPELEALALVGLSFADAVVEVLVRAPLVARLSSLDLSKGKLTDAGAAVLVAARASLAHLEVLDVSDNLLSEESIASLSAALPQAIVEPQREELDDADDA